MTDTAGEPYQVDFCLLSLLSLTSKKYIGGTNQTVPFESTSSAVREALVLIEKRIFQAKGFPLRFNEVLSAAYMERQKMAVSRNDGSPVYASSFSFSSTAIVKRD